jgi:putative transposase
MESLYKRISNKKQNSKAFKRLLIHRTNEINRICNKLDLYNVKELVLEDLKNLKHKSKLSTKFMNKMQRWSYPQVISKLGSLSEMNGIHFTKVNPAYTSQTCSKCGCVDKDSRQGESFKCLHCGNKIDADLNASINIARMGNYSFHSPINDFS